MIKSMTGYGRAQAQIEDMGISVEIKSVNHRYFEFSTKLFRNYNFLEEKIKAYVQSRVARGKIECYVSIEALEMGDIDVLVNQSLISALLDAYKETSEKFDIPNDVSISLLSRQNDAFQIRKAPADEEKIWQAVSGVLQEAVDNFIEMRKTEGLRLRDDMLLFISNILKQVDFIESRMPDLVQEYKDKLLSRLQVLLEDTSIDEQRLITEAAIFADKTAVAEELTRLRSHIDQLHKFLSSENGSGIGKTLDFVVQEMHREINTIGSKSSDIEISKAVISVKAEIEKIREQVQNIE